MGAVEVSAAVAVVLVADAQRGGGRGGRSGSGWPTNLYVCLGIQPLLGIDVTTAVTASRGPALGHKLGAQRRQRVARFTTLSPHSFKAN